MKKRRARSGADAVWTAAFELNDDVEAVDAFHEWLEHRSPRRFGCVLKDDGWILIERFRSEGTVH